MTANGRAGGNVETAPASQQGMRRQNLAAVIGAVAAHGRLSRADIAGHTGLTRPAVSSLADELIGRAALIETQTAPSGRVGRPGRALALNDKGPAGLGLEIGVTHLAACVVDLRGEPRVWRRIQRANAGRPAGQVLAETAALGADAETEAAALGLRVQGRVLAVPGVVPNAPGGLVAHAPNLGWRDVRPADHWPDPHTVPEPENEANLGALAEQRRRGRSAETFVHVSAEAGIGAALVIDGRLFRGARGFAGELGHLPVHPDGAPCPCGARGCLEQYAGERAVLREAGLDDTGDPVAVLAGRAGAGDPATLRALDRAGRALGLALTSAVDLIDPDALVLGGAYAELADWLLPPLRAELAARVTVRPWAPEAVRPSSLGRGGPVLGAAWSTVQRIIADPARLPVRRAE
ncbi:ROK family transcriptional regulator [Streptomyces sp. NPDC048352]|uniref:ROK family transcriptional regulator n=1 Tax=Streptomyces sp. NPDC048352 TaxID=3154718 RepID=UPI0034460467